MRQFILAVLACLLLGGFIVAGCGSDDDESAAGGASATTEAATDSGGDASSGGGGSSDSSESPTVETTSESKAEFMAKATELCEKRRDEIQKKSTEIFKAGQSGSGGAKAAFDSIMNAVAVGLEAEIEELQELGAPKGLEDDVGSIIEAIENMLANARENPKAFVNNPNAFNEASDFAAYYGLEACGALS